MAEKIKLSRYFFLGIFVLIADQWSKNVAMKEGIATINRAGTLGLQLTDFSLLGLSPNFFWLLVSLLIVGFVVVSMSKWRPEERNWGHLIVAAGLSNLIDRLFYGGVRDWIDLPLIAFRNNLADILLLASIVGLIMSSYLFKKDYESRDETGIKR